MRFLAAGKVQRNESELRNPFSPGPENQLAGAKITFSGRVFGLDNSFCIKRLADFMLKRASARW